ncbi:type I pullulanase [uncultured Prevotella sp.]|uniref:type I pullulanase n=1 Tax=uncultured Prevotella sp. TaxID=159272 RepID=UPI00262BFB8F|nr:type I pullulanase [uncultured Prevotella sp.]
MKLSTITLSTLLTTALPQAISAQDIFNEMLFAKDKTVFTLNSPDKPTLRLYDNGTDGKAIKTIRMKKAEDGLWRAEVKGDISGKFYTFDTGNGECPGLFAKAVGVNGNRAAVVDMRSTDPDGWLQDKRPPLKSPCDLIIYEFHHRDFSIDPSSGLQHKGKFLALTEPKATDYLKSLGVNAIHILPSFDYASVDETRLDTPQYNWGYDPKNYNVPEGSYSTDPYLPTTRIKEFKQMVQALHKAGIRVILDVVYNHTFDIKNSNFQRINPDYFYRKTADGKYSDGSGCGNETASEKPQMREYMIESAKYWAEEYHIDGFRFDLMGVHDIETMNLIRKELNKIDPSIYIYGEGWSAGSCAYPTEKLAMKANTRQLNGIGAFCDDMRDALRGPFSDNHKGGFLAGVENLEESIKFGIVGAISHPQIDMTKVNYSKEPWTNSPAQMISYVSCHDDMCLTDRLRSSIPGINEGELIRLDLLAQTAVLTSQGVPFILCGEEMLRDKKGVHNSYKSPDSINRLDWNNLKKYPEVFSYYSGLIALRKAHPAFRMGDADMVRRHLEFLDAPKGVVAFRLKDNAGGDSWKDITVILNSNKKVEEISVPEGEYTAVVKDGKVDSRGLATFSGTRIHVAPQTAMILH